MRQQGLELLPLQCWAVTRELQTTWSQQSHPDHPERQGTRESKTQSPPSSRRFTHQIEISNRNAVHRKRKTVLPRPTVIPRGTVVLIRQQPPVVGANEDFWLASLPHGMPKVRLRSRGSHQAPPHTYRSGLTHRNAQDAVRAGCSRQEARRNMLNHDSEGCRYQ